MNQAPQAVIFDMDGVLMDSENLWRMAMIQAYAEFGMNVTIEQCKKTMGMRINEVTSLWIREFNSPADCQKVVDRVVELLLELIRTEGDFMKGIPDLLSFLQMREIPMGLATSSSAILMNAILEKLGIRSLLKSTVTAELLPYGKPHPEVFLNCARELGVAPQKCLVIEDSLNGVIAAKAAQMKVIAVPDEDHQKDQRFFVADYRFETIRDVLPLIRELF